MVAYKIVKFCRACRKRYVVDKGESKKNYCDECQAKYEKEEKIKYAKEDKESKIK